MNKVILCGRLTKDPVTRYTQGENPMCICNFTLAVNRPKRGDEQQLADFIQCKCFGKIAENCAKWLKQGAKINAFGAIQTGSYTNRDGQKVYTTEVVISEYPEFLELKNQSYEFSENDMAQSGYQMDEVMPKHTKREQDPNELPPMSQKRVWQRAGSQPQQAPQQSQRQAPPRQESFMEIPDGAMDDFPFN